MRYRSLVLRALGTALLFGALFWLIDVGESLAMLQTMRVTAVVGVIVLSIVSWSVGIVKWRLLLPDVDATRLAKFYFIGLFYSLVLPGQLAGEAVKTVRLAGAGPGLGRVTASVMLDRLTGMIGLGIVSGGGLLLSRSESPLFKLMGGLICAATLAFGVVLFAIRAPVVLRAALRVSLGLSARGGYLRRAGAASRRFLSVWRAQARDLGLMTRSVLVGIVFQWLNVAIVWVIAWGMGVPLAFSDAAWVLGIVMVATLAPISFGGLGVRELGFVAVLALIGMPAAQALSISVASSAVTILGALPGLLVEVGWFGREPASALVRRRASHA